MMRVVVSDDHTLLRQSLVKVIQSQPGFEVVGEAERGEDALRVILAERPDIAILDIEMPGGSGLDVAERLRALGSEVKILMLTMHEDDASLSRAFGIGVDGYILKSASVEDMVLALKNVSEGRTHLGPRVSKRLMAITARQQSRVALTQRELEVLYLLASGVRPIEMSERLFLSPKTVKNHLSSIYTKLQVRSSAQAIAAAYKRGLVAPDRVTDSA
jgi:DNA-binding NarL/FixJ family response regulator